ncbi:PEP-CTERM sorting domain-containing protein [Kiritimatiellota bacterium B12222]|nr:PEP-CTERM sorting domain-containing protein [Kiritimatiellota bacterium B12222]
MKTTYLSILYLTIFLAALCAPSIQAQVTITNSLDSGNLISTSGTGNDSYATTYNNMGGDLLAVVMTVGSVGNLNLPTNGTGISVSFDSVAVPIISAFDSGYGNSSFFSSIYILETPSAGSASLNFDFGTNITDGVLSDNNTSTWRLGVFSLGNVDPTNPIIITDLMATAGETYSDPLISAGDFFLQGQAAFGDFGTPTNYSTSAGSETSFYDAQSVNGSRSFQVEYGSLVAGDLVGTSVTFSSDGDTRSSSRRPTVIINAIPEPSSLVLLLSALAGWVFLRRRN